ncbi:pentapeptide repeat-containing protein, partial [Rothia dentocariosa]|uniref:pentapeptide repeat-containing protein n=1 Tax=Rothia dentocariosa TaxID=2047 RepID=UPI003A8BCB2D
DFSGMTFTRSADFSRAKFTGNSDFSGVTFSRGVDFSGVTFSRGVDFSGAIFEGEPIFEYILNNKTYKARFSYKVNPENYNFNIYSKSPYKIETWDPKRNGVKFTIPKGAVLFDPDDPSEREENGES